MFGYVVRFDFDGTVVFRLGGVGMAWIPVSIFCVGGDILLVLLFIFFLFHRILSCAKVIFACIINFTFDFCVIERVGCCR